MYLRRSFKITNNAGAIGGTERRRLYRWCLWSCDGFSVNIVYSFFFIEGLCRMSILDSEHFYDALAPDYDSMTQFAERLERQKQILRAFLPLRSAVDMGSGTGLHSIALALLGVEVTGIDISGEMLLRARKHAGEHGVQPDFEQGDFFSSPSRQGQAPDLLLCLGNSLPHLERDRLQDLLRHWKGLLASDGRVLIQLLNYRRILARSERIVNIRRTGPSTVVRFYDFLEDSLQFNILTITEAEGAISHTLRGTRLSPFTSDEIASTAAAAGFQSVEIYSSLELGEFLEVSVDCVVMLRP